MPSYAQDSRQRPRLYQLSNPHSLSLSRNVADSTLEHKRAEIPLYTYHVFITARQFESANSL